MLTNWLMHAAVARALDARLRGARITGAYSQQRDVLVVECAEGGALECSCESRRAIVAFRPDAARARRNAVSLLPDLAGERIAGVDIAADDRILRIRLGSGRALLCLLFTVRGNVVLVEEDGSLVASFKAAGVLPDLRATVFTSRVDAPPPEDFVTAFSVADEPAAALRRVRPWLTGPLAEEAMHRADRAREAASGTTDTARALHAAVRALSLEAAEAGGRVYMDGRRPVSVAPVRLERLAAACAVEEFPDAAEAAQQFLRRLRAYEEQTRLTGLALHAIDRALAHAETSRARLAPPAELRRRAAEYQKYGDLLMIHMHESPEQPTRMTVPDLFTDPRLVVSIPLDPKLSVLENAQYWYDKAQRTRASVAYVTERAEEIARRIGELAPLRAGIAQADTLRTLKEILKENSRIMERMGITKDGEREERPFPFRRFHVAGGFEVWAGKSSAQNDELTFRHARPNDLWFHARGVGGSHVVLKVDSAGGAPTKEAVRQAAAIAAYYSKYRSAGSVPVAYTERKYIRKPKGVPAGTVSMEREQVVMVKPGLPEGEEDK